MTRVSFILGLILLFFLPVIESFSRQIAFNLLLTGSVLVSFPVFWKRRSAFDLVDLLWFLMLLIFTVTTTLSWSISQSYLELLRYFAYFLVFITIRRYPDPQVLLKRFFIPMVITNGVILSFLFLSSPILKLPIPSNNMSLYLPIFLGHNHIVDILIFAIPVALFLPHKTFSKVLSLFFLMIFFISVSRGAMLALVLSLFLYFSVVRKHRFPLSRFMSGWTLVFTLLVTVFLSASFIYSNFLISGNNKGSVLKGFYKPVFNENRFEYIKQAQKGFRTAPVFGTGLDTFRYVSKMYQSEPLSWSWFTHNHFLQLFAETGFLGGLLFLTLITTLLFRVFKNLNYQLSIINYQSQSIFIAVFASALHSLIDYDWQYISVFLIFWVALGILTPYKSTPRERDYSPLLQRLFIIIVIVLFLFPLAFNIESNSLLADADKLVAAGKLQEAEKALGKAYRLDSKNIDISIKFAEIEEKKEKFDAVHFWYRNAILLDTLDSQEIIRKDLSVYLNQAKKAIDKKDYTLASNYILQSIKRYPFYYKLMGGNSYLFNANKMISLKNKSAALNFLNDYVKTMQRLVKTKKLQPEEIKLISDQL